MKVYYDKDADLSLVKGKNVTIIGYGSQGHAHAQNLSDSGVRVTVGLRKGGASWTKARRPSSRSPRSARPSRRRHRHDAAARRADRRRLQRRGRAQHQAGRVARVCARLQRPLRPGRAARRPRRLDGRAEGAGHTVRSTYVQGGGVPHLIAVHADKSGEARDLALSYAAANGGGKAGVIGAAMFSGPVRHLAPRRSPGGEDGIRPAADDGGGPAPRSPPRARSSRSILPQRPRSISSPPRHHREDSPSPWRRSLRTLAVLLSARARGELRAAHADGRRRSTPGRAHGRPGGGRWPCGTTGGGCSRSPPSRCCGSASRPRPTTGTGPPGPVRARVLLPAAPGRARAPGPAPSSLDGPFTTTTGKRAGWRRTSRWRRGWERQFDNRHARLSTRAAADPGGLPPMARNNGSPLGRAPTGDDRLLRGGRAGLAERRPPRGCTRSGRTPTGGCARSATPRRATDRHASGLDGRVCGCGHARRVAAGVRWTPYWALLEGRNRRAHARRPRPPAPAGRRRGPTSASASPSAASARGPTLRRLCT